MDYAAWIRSDLIKNLIENKKFILPWNENDLPKIVDLDVKPMTTSDAFMLTNCFKIKIILSDASSEQTAEIGIIVKTSPQWFPEDDNTFTTLFQNEAYAYDRLFSALEWKGYLPKYYYSHIRGSKDCVIALGDFTLAGYQMCKAKGKLSLEHICEAVQLLGEFHGLSYALKHTNLKQFNEIKDLFKEGKYFEGRRYSEPWATIIGNGPTRVIKTVREHQTECKIPEHFLIKLEQMIGYPLEYERTMYLDQKEPFATFSHGDFVRNNIAFKYNEWSEDIPEKMTMFDFQTIRYASPMIDLVNFMAISTGVDVRSKHFDYIFQKYYHRLVETYCERTAKENGDLPEFLSYDSMLKEYGRIMPLGISIASFFLPLCLAKDGVNLEEATTLPFNETVQNEFQRGGEYVNRELRALVYDLYHFYQNHSLELPN